MLKKEIKKERVNELLKIGLISILISLVVTNLLFIPCVVHQSSMFPTLRDNEIGISFIATRNIAINRFEICVLKLKNENKLIVKRIIGIPGDTIEYKNNKLYINGYLTKEKYLTNEYTENLKIKLGDDEYYCLGDNRDVSIDSRYYGPFNKEDIVATNMLILFPFKDAGFKK